MYIYIYICLNPLLRHDCPGNQDMFFMSRMIKIEAWVLLYLPRPRRGLRGIVFTRSVCLCVCVCVCVRPIFWYFISRLLEEISV